MPLWKGIVIRLMVYKGLGFKVLGFRVLGFRVLGLRVQEVDDINPALPMP